MAATYVAVGVASPIYHMFEERKAGKIFPQRSEPDEVVQLWMGFRLAFTYRVPANDLLTTWRTHSTHLSPCTNGKNGGR